MRVGLLERGRPGGLSPQPLVLEQDAHLRRERLQDAPVAGRERAAGEGEHAPVVDRQDGVGVVRCGGGARAVRGDGPPAVVAPLEQGDGAEGERLAEPGDERGGGVLAGQHGARHRGERGRLGPGAVRLGRPPRREVDDRRHRGRDEHEHAEREGVLRVGDGEPPGGPGEEPVGEQVPEHRARDRGPQAADERHHHGEREVQHEVAREAQHVPHPVEHHREQDRPDDPEQRAGNPAAA